MSCIYACFNRTFMELKYGGIVINGLPALRFNRTFMELKFDSRIRKFKICCMFQSYLYGIVITYPQCVSLWNICFNRTFMELKWNIGRNVIASGWVSIVPLWNWNCNTIIQKSRYSSFNRTFMELKLVGFGVTKFRLRKFQSYLYGIEIQKVQQWKLHLQKFQSYLYGIEIPATSARTQWKDRFNRTFMELKYGTKISLSIYYQLIINTIRSKR